MAKVSQSSAKYVIHANIDIDGVVDRPDVVGAIFGQIEGLLGADLELRELQRSGRIGRIEVNVKSNKGKTQGNITIPSSLDKAETAIVGGALEIIERIGPCSAKINVTRIEDERISKRQQVIARAKQLLQTLNDKELPDSQELAGEVTESVKMMTIIEYGSDKLAAGPDILEQDEVIFVEGRADVINLLRHGFNNAISVNGTSAPKTIQELSKNKTVTLFTDGDRGGDLIIKELMEVCKIDFVCKAPDGKEVEELQKKEIHQALRSKVKAADWGKKSSRGRSRKGDESKEKSQSRGRSKKKSDSKEQQSQSRKPSLSAKDKEHYAQLLKDLKKDQAWVLDKENEPLGQVSISDLGDALPNLDGVSVVVANGALDNKASQAVDKARVKYIVATGGSARAPMATPEDLK